MPPLPGSQPDRRPAKEYDGGPDLKRIQALLAYGCDPGASGKDAAEGDPGGVEESRVRVATRPSIYWARTGLSGPQAQRRTRYDRSIEREDHRPLAVMKRPQPVGRKISQCIALAKAYEETLGYPSARVAETVPATCQSFQIRVLQTRC